MNFFVFDAHCDTIEKITDNNASIYKNDFQLDLSRMLKYPCGYAQIFAAFIDREVISVTPFFRAEKMIEKFYSELKKNSELISLCTSAEEIRRCKDLKRIAAILSVEGGEAIEGDIGKLEKLYSMGVRAMTLTWNYDNEISGGILGVKQNGLTEFGTKIVKKMNDLGMLVDISHISEKGFWDVIEVTEKPIAATHSNAYELRDNRRNLNDEQIKALIKNNGCIGINLYSEFLTNGKGMLCDVIRHIEYICSLGGERCVGLGSDFDGTPSLPDGIDGVQDMYKIGEELLRLGYSESLVGDIMSDNFIRVFEAVL